MVLICVLELGAEERGKREEVKSRKRDEENGRLYWGATTHFRSLTFQTD
jgi:hypothetical protein